MFIRYPIPNDSEKQWGTDWVSGIGPGTRQALHMESYLSCLSGASQYYPHPAPTMEHMEISTMPGLRWTGGPKLRPALQPILTSITGEPRFELDIITFVRGAFRNVKCHEGNVMKCQIS